MSDILKARRSGRRPGAVLTPFAVGLLAGLGLAAMDEELGVATTPRPERDGPAARGKGRGWRGIAAASVRAFAQNHISTAAAGVTFYVLLSLFPALSAFVSLYGLVANVDDARRQLLALGGLLPGGAVEVLGGQLTRLAAVDHRSLGFAFAVSLLVSLWSSNAGTKALLEGLNVAYESPERRGFVRLNLASLALTLGAIAFVGAAVAATAGAPAVLARLGVGRIAILAVARWPVFLVVASGLFSLLYRFGPSRERARWRWVTPGGVVAALGWMAMSSVFTWYVANFGHFDRTYGSLGAIVGFLIWIWLSVMVVLFGAELNAEIERRALARPPAAQSTAPSLFRPLVGSGQKRRGPGYISTKSFT